MKERYYIGVDVGGTSIKAGAVSERGVLLHLLIRRTGDCDRTEEGIVSAIKGIVDEIENRLGYKCTALGVGLPGFINMREGVVTFSPNFPEWKNFPARDMLTQELRRKVVLDNDANLFAVGEGWMGAGRNMNSFMGITLGTGVGAGIVLNGEVWYGADGTAGEFGHITVDPDGPLCTCGNTGCVETFVSSRGILGTAEKIYGKKLDVSEVEAPEFVYKRALNGDKKAQEVLEFSGRMLGIGLASVANLLNLDGVIIGGGIGRAFRFLIKGVKKEMVRANPIPRRRMKILKSKLFEKANILGGAYQAIKNERRSK